MDDSANTLLVPSPESVVQLIDQIVTLGWPDKEGDQAGYLRQLGFHQGEGQAGFQQGSVDPTDLESAAVLGGELLSSDLGVSNASWSSHDGELFSIGFFLYEGRNSRENGAIHGYHRIYSRLLSRYGQPADTTVRPSNEASSYWEVDGTSIEMYCYSNPSPLLQLGLGHILRNAASEAHMS
jgi:hypothetical protein